MLSQSSLSRLTLQEDQSLTPEGVNRPLGISRLKQHLCSKSSQSSHILCHQEPSSEKQCLSSLTEPFDTHTSTPSLGPVWSGT